MKRIPFLRLFLFAALSLGLGGCYTVPETGRSSFILPVDDVGQGAAAFEVKVVELGFERLEEGEDGEDYRGEGGSQHQRQAHPEAAFFGFGGGGFGRHLVVG